MTNIKINTRQFSTQVSTRTREISNGSEIEIRSLSGRVRNRTAELFASATTKLI